MGIILIIVGVLLIGFVVLNKSSVPAEGSVDVDPSLSKYLLGAAGAGCFLIAIYLLYTTGDTWSVSPWRGFINIPVAIGFAIGGIYLFSIASETEQKRAQNAEARAKAKAAYTNHDLEEERRLTEAAKFRNQRTEVQIRDVLAPEAVQGGMDVSTLIGVNADRAKSDTEVGTYERKRRIDTRHYGEEKSIDLQYIAQQNRLDVEKEAETARTQLDAADRVEHYRLVAQLEADLDDLLVQRRKIELEETDEVLREQRIERINVRIGNLKKDIDGRQNRLLSTGNGQENQRLS